MAIAGTSVGARIGFRAIPDRFVDRLEPVDVILELADNITTDCPMSDWGPSNPVWENKYIYDDDAYWRRRNPDIGKPQKRKLTRDGASLVSSPQTTRR